MTLFYASPVSQKHRMGLRKESAGEGWAGVMGGGKGLVSEALASQPLCLALLCALSCNPPNRLPVGIIVFILQN